MPRRPWIGVGVRLEPGNVRMGMGGTLFWQLWNRRPRLGTLVLSPRRNRTGFPVRSIVAYLDSIVPSRNRLRDAFRRLKYDESTTTTTAIRRWESIGSCVLENRTWLIRRSIRNSPQVDLIMSHANRPARLHPSTISHSSAL